MNVKTALGTFCLGMLAGCDTASCVRGEDKELDCTVQSAAFEESYKDDGKLLTGAILVALVVFVVELVFGWLQRRLTPWVRADLLSKRDPRSFDIVDADQRTAPARL